MSGVKDIKPPKSERSTGGKKPPKDKPEKSDAPWSTNDAGERVRSTRALPHEVRLREIFAEAAALLKGADSFSGILLEAKGEELAYGYAKLAKEDPRVKRVLERILEGSAWSAALAPTVTLAVCIAWHYGMIPGKVGVPLVIANGMLPISREEEMAMRAQAAQEQAQAERDNGGGGKPSD